MGLDERMNSFAEFKKKCPCSCNCFIAQEREVGSGKKRPRLTAFGLKRRLSDSDLADDVAPNSILFE